MLNMLPSAQKMRAEVHCEKEKFKQLLNRYHLRPTRQRLIIASYLFRESKRHIHADMLHEEITAAGEVISVATIYNNLRCFCTVGLIRAVPSRGIRQWFCTDISSEYQFYLDDGEHIEPLGQLSEGIEHFSNKKEPFLNLPDLTNIPEGYEIAHIDVSIYLERISKIRRPC